MYAELAGSLDDLLASEESGLAPALSELLRRLQDLANDPASATWRQFALSDAAHAGGALSLPGYRDRGPRQDRMNTAGARAWCSEINALADDIAGSTRKSPSRWQRRVASCPTTCWTSAMQRVNELAPWSE